MPSQTVLQEFPDTSEVEKLRTSLNQLIADYNTLVAKLNADAGVADTNYATTSATTINTHK